ARRSWGVGKQGAARRGSARRKLTHLAHQLGGGGAVRRSRTRSSAGAACLSPSPAAFRGMNPRAELPLRPRPPRAHARVLAPRAIPARCRLSPPDHRREIETGSVVRTTLGLSAVGVAPSKTPHRTSLV